jgi:hypothetical protein
VSQVGTSATSGALVEIDFHVAVTNSDSPSGFRGLRMERGPSKVRVQQNPRGIDDWHVAGPLESTDISPSDRCGVGFLSVFKKGARFLEGGTSELSSKPRRQIGC